MLSPEHILAQSRHAPASSDLPHAPSLVHVPLILLRMRPVSSAVMALVRPNCPGTVMTSRPVLSLSHLLEFRFLSHVCPCALSLSGVLYLFYSLRPSNKERRKNEERRKKERIKTDRFDKPEEANHCGGPCQFHPCSGGKAAAALCYAIQTSEFTHESVSSSLAELRTRETER